MMAMSLTSLSLFCGWIATMSESKNIKKNFSSFHSIGHHSISYNNILLILMADI